MPITSYLLHGPRVVIRRVRSQDYDELTALAPESAAVLRRCLAPARTQWKRSRATSNDLSSPPVRAS